MYFCVENNIVTLFPKYVHIIFHVYLICIILLYPLTEDKNTVIYMYV